jgi:hypothetical protein
MSEHVRTETCQVGQTCVSQAQAIVMMGYAEWPCRVARAGNGFEVALGRYP